jgi:hypothetical protein
MRLLAQPDVGLSPEDEAALRYALLSVYYGSVGKQLEIRGAPAVLLPPEVRPLSLGEALEQISRRWNPWLRDAVWRVVRSVPAPKTQAEDETKRYPAELARVLPAECHLHRLDALRRRYRKGANLFAAALVAHVEGRDSEFEALQELVAELYGEDSIGLEHMVGLTAPAFLDELTDNLTAERLRRLVTEVGLDLHEYAHEFADAAAFLEWWPPKGKGMTVYPAAAVLTQEVRTLITTVTVTALVRCDEFETLARAVDPRCWAWSSDVITGTRYVRGPFDLRPSNPPELGKGWPAKDGPRLLEENVAISSGFGANAAGLFRNVLRIEKFEVKNGGDPTIDLEFSLSRCISSRILWDARPGGILVDQGFIKVRRIFDGRWRITTRKVLKFSDRTPNSTAAGWLDVGEMLNYLAPAALTWWLESELYSAADDVYSNPDKVARRVAILSEGGG